MEAQSHSMDFTSILFNKVNLVNVFAYIGFFMLNVFQMISDTATVLIPIVTLFGGIILLFFNGIKLYRELFNKRKK